MIHIYRTMKITDKGEYGAFFKLDDGGEYGLHGHSQKVKVQKLSALHC